MSVLLRRRDLANRNTSTNKIRKWSEKVKNKKEAHTHTHTDKVVDKVNIAKLVKVKVLCAGNNKRII